MNIEHQNILEVDWNVNKDQSNHHVSNDAVVHQTPHHLREEHCSPRRLRLLSVSVMLRRDLIRQVIQFPFVDPSGVVRRVSDGQVPEDQPGDSEQTATVEDGRPAKRTGTQLSYENVSEHPRELVAGGEDRSSQTLLIDRNPLGHHGIQRGNQHGLTDSHEESGDEGTLGTEVGGESWHQEGGDGKKSDGGGENVTG